MLLPCRPLPGNPWGKILTLKNVFVLGRFHCHPSICGRKQNYKLCVRGFNAGRRQSWYGHIVVKQGYVSYQWLVERLNCTCGVSLASSVSFISSNECAMQHPAFTTTCGLSFPVKSLAVLLVHQYKNTVIKQLCLKNVFLVQSESCYFLNFQGKKHVFTFDLST